jgi:hypothetical protein
MGSELRYQPIRQTTRQDAVEMLRQQQHWYGPYNGAPMDFIDKLVTIEEAIAAEKGDFVLFAVVQREEAPNRWDLLLSAPWFGAEDKETLDFIVSKLKGILTPQEMVLLSRIVLFPPNDPRVNEIQKRIQKPVTHGHVELSEWELAGMPVSHAHIVTAAEEHSNIKTL